MEQSKSTIRSRASSRTGSTPGVIEITIVALLFGGGAAYIFFNQGLQAASPYIGLTIVWCMLATDLRMLGLKHRNMVIAADLVTQALQETVNYNKLLIDMEDAEEGDKRTIYQYREKLGLLNNTLNDMLGKLGGCP